MEGLAQPPWRLRLVGDPVRGRILVVDIEEGNGQACNGRLEVVG